MAEEKDETSKGDTAEKSQEEDDDDEEDLFGGDDEEEDPSADKNGSNSPSENAKAESATDSAPAEPPSTDLPIPKLTTHPSKSTPPAPSSGGAPPVGLSAAAFGLPEGSKIPITVHASLLQGRLLETLRSLPVQLINDALTEYDDAVQIKGAAIRNHGAYLYGVIKRYVSVQERAQAGEGQGILPMGPDLTPAVNARLQKLVDDSFCSEEEMNEKVKSKIRMLSEKDALFAIEELASVERKQIRNFGSYFMGILNRYMRGESSAFKKGDDKKRQDRGRFDERRRDDQFNRPDMDQRRGRESTLHDRNESYRRERSRDRYDQDRRRDAPNDWRDQYDPRKANLPFPGQTQPLPMGGVPGNPPPPPPRNNPPGILGNNQYSLQQPQRMMQPQQMFAQPPPNQSRFVPHAGGPPPPSSAYGQPPGSHPPPPHGPSGIGPQYNSQGVVPSPYSNPQPGLGAAPQFRGKPPSNSYGVPMNQPPMAGQQPPQSYNNNRFSQPPTHPPGGWQNPQGGLQNPPQGHGLPVDILGLADKAASAVQALQNQMQMPPGVPQMRQPGTTSPPGPHMQQGMPPQMSIPQAFNSPMPGQPAGSKAMAARRRTTASMIELPVTVQYAVQNLQATGQIDGPLDEGMLGMVKDLPESLALQALQKFATIDKNTMRNKTAYLAGVLRRELEKINRR